jgi:plasmid maintenance system antidote protein VapI
VTTFSACERALGKRLVWPIITFDRIECFRWRKAVRGEEGAYTPMSVDSEDYPLLSKADVEELRRLSGKQTYQADDKPLDAPFEPDWASPPGETIEELLESREATTDDLARRLNLTRDQMNDLMKGTLPLTERIATDLCSVLGGSVQFWINRENQYRQDLARLARQAEGED